MKLSTILAEARSHTKQNPKTSVNQHIIDAADKALAAGEKIAGVLNCFVSLTAIDKLGINPKSKYNTPLGIYSYPANYVIREVMDNAKLDTLPFAGEQPYVNIFSAQGNVIDLGTITDVEVSNLYKKIAAVYHSLTGHSWKQDMDEVEEIINNATQHARVKSLPGGQLWYVTKMLAKHFKVPWETTAPVAWNKLFREIGVDGAIDMGNGIIHTNESTQAVFFSTKAITNVNRVLNKYSPDAVTQGVERGETQKQTAAELIAMHTNTTDQQKIDIINTKGSEFLKYVKHPSEAVQQAAIDDVVYNIKYINNPTESIQLQVVSKSGRLIQYIKNPSEKVQLAAVEQLPAAGQYINNPTEKVQMAMVIKKLYSINYIKNPTTKVKQYAASKWG